MSITTRTRRDLASFAVLLERFRPREVTALRIAEEAANVLSVHRLTAFSDEDVAWAADEVARIRRHRHGITRAEADAQREMVR